MKSWIKKYSGFLIVSWVKKIYLGFKYMYVLDINDVLVSCYINVEFFKSKV